MENLNGEWGVRFRRCNEGREQNWHDGALARAHPCAVPIPKELSGINDRGVHEVVCGMRDFEMPDEWSGRDLLLHFGAVDYAATLWVNGQEVGHNQGGHVPFSFDIAPYLKTGRNRLTLRVTDAQDPHQPRGKQSVTGLPHDIDYYCTTGIWQTVWLEPVSAMRIDELQIITDAARSIVDVDVYLHVPSGRWRVETEIAEDGNVVARAEERIAIATGKCRLSIPYAKLWSPSTPNLYDLRVRLYEGERAGTKSFLFRNAENRNPRRERTLERERLFEDDLDQVIGRKGISPSFGRGFSNRHGIRKLFGSTATQAPKNEDPRWRYWATVWLACRGRDANAALVVAGGRTSRRRMAARGQTRL